MDINAQPKYYLYLVFKDGRAGYLYTHYPVYTLLQNKTGATKARKTIWEEQELPYYYDIWPNLMSHELQLAE